MKKADLYRQGDIGQMYMANGGITRLGYQFGGGADAGGVNSPGGGTFGGSSNTGAGDDHSYKNNRERQIHRNATTSSYTPAQIGTLSDPREKKDYFTQTYSGQPGFLGFGGGYRNLRTPNVAGSGYQSRFNPMGLMSLLGGFISRPFSLAVSGINAARNKFGPAFNNFTSSKTLEQFRDKMRGYGRTMPTYSPYLKFGGIETLGQEMPEEINIDEFQPYGVDVENLYEDFPTEEIVATGTNYPGDTNYLGDTETILELEKAKEINDRIKEKQREQEATKGAYYP
jgi:hypothetical protein